MINTQVLKGNLIRQDYTTAFVLNQGDKGVPFKIELLENGAPYILLSDDTVSIEWYKPNGSPFLQDTGITKGDTYIEITTPEAIAQHDGVGSFNIIISNGDVRKGTIRREYKVIPTSMRPGSVSEDTITDAITELRNLNTKLAETVQNNQTLINNNSAATKSDIASVNSSLEENTKFGYLATLFTNLKQRFESKYVNVKDFGAVGDGITNDTTAIQNAISYCNTNKIDLFFPKGNYLVSETLYVNVENFIIYGISGLTYIIASASFTGNVLIYLYGDNGEWAERKSRIRTLGNFNLLNNCTTQNITAIRTSGETGTSYEGHVDRITVQNIMINGFYLGVLYGSHSYAFIFEKLYTPYCTYALKSEDTQTDSGEIPVFRNCFFADSGHRIYLKSDIMFLNCTFHSIGDIDGEEAGITADDCMLTFNQCHFERIQREDMGDTYYSPLMRLTTNTSVITIQSSRFVVSGGSSIQYKECMIDNSNGGTLNWQYNEWEWYYKRLYFDETTLQTNGKLPCVVKTDGKGIVNYKGYNQNMAWDSGKVNMLTDVSIVNDYTFSNLDGYKNLFKLIGTDGLEVSDVTATTRIVADTQKCRYNNAYKINLNNATSDTKEFYVGVMLNIPSGSNCVGLKLRYWFTTFDSSTWDNESYKFYDDFGNLIPETDVTKLNDNLTFTSSATVDTIYEKNDVKFIRKIPSNARKVFIGVKCKLLTNTNGDLCFDYFAPFFM